MSTARRYENRATGKKIRHPDTIGPLPGRYRIRLQLVVVTLNFGFSALMPRRWHSNRYRAIHSSLV